MKTPKGMLKVCQSTWQAQGKEHGLNTDGDTCYIVTRADVYRVFAMEGFVVRKGKGCPAADRYITTWIYAGEASEEGYYEDSKRLFIHAGKYAPMEE